MTTGADPDGSARSVDDPMLAYLRDVAVPDLGDPPFSGRVDVSRAQVAIVTTAGLQTPEQDEFERFDTSFRVLDDGCRNLQMSHTSQNFDRAGVIADLDVVYPVHRLHELAEGGVIGSVAPTHISFMGAQRELDTLVHDTGRMAAAHLREQGTDVAILTPV